MGFLGFWVFGFLGFGVLGLRVWGQGLTIFKKNMEMNGLKKLGSVSCANNCVNGIIKIGLSVHTSRYRTNERLSCQGISEIPVIGSIFGESRSDHSPHWAQTQS